MNVPKAVVGEHPTGKQWEAIFAYLGTHPERRHPGIIVTARLANEAIEWFNERDMDEHHLHPTDPQER